MLSARIRDGFCLKMVEKSRGRATVGETMLHTSGGDMACRPQGCEVSSAAGPEAPGSGGIERSMRVAPTVHPPAMLKHSPLQHHTPLASLLVSVNAKIQDCLPVADIGESPLRPTTALRLLACSRQSPIHRQRRSRRRRMLFHQRCLARASVIQMGRARRHGIAVWTRSGHRLHKRCRSAAAQPPSPPPSPRHCDTATSPPHQLIWSCC